MNEPKRLRRSRDNVIIAGICAGLGKYFKIDPVIIRIAWVLLTFAAVGGGVVAYLICWLIIPREPFPGGGVETGEM